MFNYGVKALYVGGASPYSWLFEQLSINTVQNVVSTNIGLVYPRADIMGWDGGGHQIQIDRPHVQLSYSYLPVSGYNENNIGFVVGGFASALNNLNIEKNYYISANLQGVDAVSYTGNNTCVMALGNCALTHYDFAAAVGQLTIATVTTEALNLLIQTGNSGQILPAITKQTASAITGQYVLPSALKAVGNFTEVQPGSINLTFDSGCAIGTALSGNNACLVQAFRFSLDIPRQSSKSLGWAYPDTRTVIWPLTVNIQADVILNTLQTDALNRFSCTDSGYNFNVQFKNSCTTNDSYGFQFQGAKLNSQSISARIGGSDVVSFNWSLKINDVNRWQSGNPNFAINGQPPIAYTGVTFPQVMNTLSTGPLVINFGTGCYISVIQGAAWLSGNNVFYPDYPETATIRATYTGLTEYQDISIAVY